VSTMAGMTVSPPPSSSIQAELLRHLRPQTSRNAPVYASSMMPIEMVEMSLGRSLGEFREEWEGALAAGLAK